MSASILNPESAEPMMEINTTPLIDVMLVLLIMIIMTIPIQTHAVKLDLPQNSQSTPPPIDPVKNKVVITPQGQVLWNGVPVNLVTLRQYLDLTTTMHPVPELLKLLKGLELSRQKSRPVHPEADPKAQERFKKPAGPDPGRGDPAPRGRADRAVVHG